MPDLDMQRSCWDVRDHGKTGCCACCNALASEIGPQGPGCGQAVKKPDKYHAIIRRHLLSRPSALAALSRLCKEPAKFRAKPEQIAKPVTRRDHGTQTN